MRFFLPSAVIVISIFFSGCSTVYPTGVSIQPPIKEVALVQPEQHKQQRHIVMPVPREYRINPGDQLSVLFPRRPGYSNSYLVMPDGRITLPNIGSVKAAAKTPDQLQKILRHRYQRLITNLPPPRDRSYRLNAGDVLDIRFSYFTEGNTVVTVRTDGRVSLPILGDVLAEGLTPVQLQDELTKLFAPKVPNPNLVVVVREAQSNVYYYRGKPRVMPDAGLLELSVNVTRTMPQLVFVGGEVPAPGVQPYYIGSSAMQAILSAGGPTPTADMRSAVILRRGPDNKVVRMVTDLTQDLSGNGTGDVSIRPFDVIVVPRSRIAKTGDAFDQYLYRIIRPLANSSVGFYFTKQVGTVDQHSTVNN